MARFLWLALSLCWLAGNFTAAGQEPAVQPTKNILIVFSEKRELPGNASMEQALRAEMTRAGTNYSFEFYDENLDATHFADANHARAFRDYLGLKYQGMHLDMVVAFLSKDFNLTNELPARLIAHIPVIFVAVSQLEIPEILRRPGFTGIFQRYDVSGTLSLIFRLQPETHRIVVVGGVASTDRLTLDRIKTAATNMDNIEFEFWTNRPLAQMAVGLATLPPGTAILLSTVQRDVADKPYYSSEMAAMILPKANAPVFVLSSGPLGSGVVGGAVVDNVGLGTRAGQLAIQRLNGYTNTIPVEERTEGRPQLDWKALKRWGMDPRGIPKEWLINRPAGSMWEQYKGVILTTAAVLLAQAFTIAGLLVNRYHRQRAELRARVNQEARALVAAIVESSDAAIIRKDLNGYIVTWNRSAERLFGYTAAEAVGKHIIMIVPPSLMDEEVAILEQSQRGVSIASFETMRLHKNGRNIQVSVSISPILDETGKVVGASKTCRDITALKAAETEIRQQRDELAHVTRVSTLGQLTSAITHELNQPLGAILRNAEAAEMFLQSEQPDLNEVRAILADIRKDDQRAGQVIERMRSLLKRRSLVSDPLDVREIVDDTIALVRQDLTTRQVKLSLEIPPHVPIVLGDRVHLQQVLLNLILNGMDAMNAVPFAARELKVRVAPLGVGYLEISVSDSGTGLPAPDRLFEPFYTTKPNGMGMGLAISRTIIEAHGGKIRAENNELGGATFTLSLPATEVEI